MKIRRMTDSNLSAITDERGDLIFDRDSPRYSNPGLWQAGQITNPHGEANRGGGSWIVDGLYFLVKMAMLVGVIVLLLSVVTGRLSMNSIFTDRKALTKETPPPEVQTQVLPYAVTPTAQPGNESKGEAKIADAVSEKEIDNFTQPSEKPTTIQGTDVTKSTNNQLEMSSPKDTLQETRRVATDTGNVRKTIDGHQNTYSKPLGLTTAKNQRDGDRPTYGYPESSERKLRASKFAPRENRTPNDGWERSRELAIYYDDH